MHTDVVRDWFRTVVLVGVVGLSAGCSATGSAPAADSTPGATSTASPTSGTVDQPAAPTGTFTALPQPVKTPVAKVRRDGAVPKPTASAPPVAFDQPAAYEDGVRLTIDKLTTGVETGQGPGIFAGREYVRLELSLTNGSDKPISLDGVVVTAFYGKSNQLASPVYAQGVGAVDLGGTVAPGASAHGVYAVAVPASQRGNVTVVVDFDGGHSSATFTGKVG